MRKAWLLIAAILLSLASVIPAAQEKTEFKIRKGLKFEFTPAPNAADKAAMFADYDDPRYEWGTVRPYISLIKLYAGQLIKDPWPDAKLNFGDSYAELRDSGALRKIRRNLELGMAIEVGIVKPGNCGQNDSDQDRAAAGIAGMVGDVYDLDGYVTRLDVDTSLGQCGNSTRDTAFGVSQAMDKADDGIAEIFADLHKDYPLVNPGWAEIEPYPGFPISTHIEYMREINAFRKKEGREGLEAYFLDIDQKLVSDAELKRDVLTFVYAAHAQGVKVGIILNGEVEEKDHPWIHKDYDYVKTQIERLDRFQRLGLFDIVDIVMFQSWTTALDGDRSIPWSTPESHPGSQTNFALHTLECLSDLVPCSYY